jgi:hypothetical protein
MPLAMSKPVVPRGYSRRAPSGKLMVIFSTGAAGFRLLRLYWKPGLDWSAADFESGDLESGDLESDRGLSLSSLLRTSAGKREQGV